MAQSVKLTNGSYIDTEGVYDATKGETQSAINNRLGTTLQTPLNTAGTWTPTEVYSFKEVASLTLPVGKWLVIGQYMTSVGCLHLWISAGGFSSRQVAAIGSVSVKTTVTAFAAVEGGKTVTLSLYATKTGVTHTWTQDTNYFNLTAICIG